MSERTHDQEWLVKNAMFSCRNDGCREEVSYHFTEFRLMNDHSLICENCYEYDWSEGIPLWNELKAFNPFPTPQKGGE